jgi:plastocyanin
MRKRMIFTGAACVALAMLAFSPSARADGWGSVKGQVVWAGGDVPKRDKLKVDKDQDACLAHGDLLSEKYVVDPKSKGVRWVVVWLVDPKKPTAALPIAPDLKTIKNKKLTLDQPTCMFEPHILAIRNGQEIDFKNTAKVPHNINLVKPVVGPNLNQIVPPGGHLLVSSFKPTGTSPVNVTCTIHGWMKGYIWVFRDPYFAVTDADGNFEIKDAPAGTWNLVAWQDEGWVGAGGKTGTPVTITAGGATDVGKIELKP